MNHTAQWDPEAYLLLDSGSGDKLERIAGHWVQRPCPQAIWPRRLDERAWSRAQSVCERTPDGGGRWRHDRGEHRDLALSWGDPALAFQIQFTSFGHCGVFFEQAPVWQLLQDRLRNRHTDEPAKAINLFGYTGAASLAMAAAGAEVFHFDSAKGVLNWGKQNARLQSGLPGQIRWIHEDVRSFLALSAKRDFTYDVILADPPSWGHGVQKKDVWTFDAEIFALARSCAERLRPGGTLVLTCHTHGVQHQALANVLSACGLSVETTGDLGVAHSEDQRILPAGLISVGTKQLV
jgi:23S rRNA (cytosine1962-C5)-methyltransferase